MCAQAFLRLAAAALGGKRGLAGIAALLVGCGLTQAMQSEDGPRLPTAGPLLLTCARGAPGVAIGPGGEVWAATGGGLAHWRAGGIPGALRTEPEIAWRGVAYAQRRNEEGEPAQAAPGISAPSAGRPSGTADPGTRLSAGTSEMNSDEPFALGAVALRHLLLMEGERQAVLPLPDGVEGFAVAHAAGRWWVGHSGGVSMVRGGLLEQVPDVPPAWRLVGAGTTPPAEGAHAALWGIGPQGAFRLQPRSPTRRALGADLRRWPLPAGLGPPFAAAACPGGMAFSGVASDGALRVWLATPSGVKPLPALPARGSHVAALAAEGKVLLAAVPGAGLWRWDGKAWSPVAGAPAHIAALALSDGFLAAGTWGEGVWTCRLPLDGHHSPTATTRPSDPRSRLITPAGARRSTRPAAPGSGPAAPASAGQCMPLAAPGTGPAALASAGRSTRPVAPALLRRPDSTAPAASPGTSTAPNTAGAWTRLSDPGALPAGNIQALALYQRRLVASTFDQGILVSPAVISPGGAGAAAWQKVCSPEISSDAPRQLAVWRRRLLVRHGDGRVDAWNGTAWERDLLRRRSHRPWCAAVAVDGDRAAFGGWGAVTLCSGNRWRMLPLPEPWAKAGVTALAWRGDTLILGSDRRGAALFHISEGRLQPLRGPDDPWITTLAAGSEGALIGSYNTGVAWWHPDGEGERNALPGPVMAVALHPSRPAAVATRAGVWLWRRGTWDPVPAAWVAPLEPQALFATDGGFWAGGRAGIAFHPWPNGQ